MELFAAPQTCHVLPCFLPLRKPLPLPGMSFFTLLQSPSAWETLAHPLRLSSTLLLKAFYCSSPSSPSSLIPNAHGGDSVLYSDGLSISPHTPGFEKAQDPVYAESSWDVLRQHMHTHTRTQGPCTTSKHPLPPSCKKWDSCHRAGKQLIRSQGS